MSEADWTVCNDSTASIKRGVTNGIARPNGGGNFVYGFNSTELTPGCSALFCNLANFAPAAKGMSVSCAIKRGVSGGPAGFAPFLYVLLAGPSVHDDAYILGLEDADPHKIVLRKGALEEGVPSVALGTMGTLRKSTASYAVDTWLHLRLDAIVQPNNDVLLKAFRSDLSNPVTSPAWVAIPGIGDFVDDALGVNSGSTPLLLGRGGFGFQSEDVTRRGFFDHIAVNRQL